jgi:5-methylcytosine-specific restriction enzyme subunit McrC
MNSFLFNTLTEHHNYPNGEPIPSEVAINTLRQEILFQNNMEKKCIEIKKDNTLHTHYFIGVDWISSDKAVYVGPKLNTSYTDSNDVIDSSRLKETDFLKMLFHCLKYQDIGSELEKLFEVKWEQPTIEIEQKRDMLTPLLVVQFLGLVKIIVRKGLKKSYYKVENNLNSRVKGRVLVGRTLKENIFKNKNLNTVCSYDEFGLNGLENRLLKRTLSFIRNYLPVFKTLNTDTYIQNLFSCITPAFESASEEVNLNEIRFTKTNPFYKEYEEAIKLAKMILKRFGYNISNVEKQTIQTHPFWIDMSKLFELYVLGLLKDQFKSQVIYHPTYNSKELDYLLLNPPMVIDAKYKPRYLYTSVLEDARQLSGYSRMHKVYDALNFEKDKIIDCLIIYPNQESGNKNLSKFIELMEEPDSAIREYVNFYKIGIELPVVKNI